jgi:sulfhydrogenase subunit alpha
MNRIDVPALARVEGEGGLFIGLRDGQAVEVRLDIYEPPRFFEGFLRDRFLQDVPDITARICGICPVAYQMSSAIALEAALGVQISPEVYALRRLMYCGEYIESHALHMFMLQAPDLFGRESVLELAASEPDIVRNALRLKKLGNAILSCIGGRSVHPVNVCVGGFYSWPSAESVRSLLPELEWALDTAVRAAHWAGTLSYPQLQIDYEFVALHHGTEYGLMRGEVLSSSGKATPVAKYEQEYVEYQVPHSNALHSKTRNGTPYMVGPLARLNLNHEQLMPGARSALDNLRLNLPLRNPHLSFVARAIELVHFVEEAIQLASTYSPEGASRIDLAVKAGEGTGASEAPRGLLYHRYQLDEAGLVQSARIVPPTAQNLPRMESDLRAMAAELASLPSAEATRRAEDLVRAYDPCISCATHFLKLRIQDTEAE